VEKNIAKHGARAVNAPILVDPWPMEAASSKLAKVQFKESMP
jgi:hypothetical protein